MASPSSPTSPSAFSPSRSLLLKKSSGRFFSSNCTYDNRQLNFSENGGLSLHRRGGSGSSLSLRVVCLRDFRTPKVTQESWDKLVLKSERPVLVEFYASWCGPCQMVHRVINDIAFEYRGKVNCFSLNTDSDLDIAESYDIKAVPVVLIFKNGKKQESIVGTMPKEFYEAAIRKALGIQV